MRLLQSVLILSVLLLQPAVQAADAHLYRLDDVGRIHILAHVDGRGPFEFLLDTAAGRTTINRSLVYRMDLEPHPFKSLQVRTATGLVASQIYTLGGLSALGQTVRLGTVPALEAVKESGRYGIIGVDLLRGHVLHLGRSGQGVRLLTTAQPFQQANWTLYQGRPVGRGSLALDVTLGDVRLPAVIDTGASQSVINLPAMRALIADGAFLEIESTARIITAAGRQRGGTIRAAKAKRINDTPWEVSRLTVADLPIFSFLGAKRVPAMILGMDLLADKDFAIDFQAWSLYLRTEPETQPIPDLDALTCCD